MSITFVLLSNIVIGLTYRYRATNIILNLATKGGKVNYPTKFNLIGHHLLMLHQGHHKLWQENHKSMFGILWWLCCYPNACKGAMSVASRNQLPAPVATLHMMMKIYDGMILMPFMFSLWWLIEKALGNGFQCWLQLLPASCLLMGDSCIIWSHARSVLHIVHFCPSLSSLIISNLG